MGHFPLIAWVDKRYASNVFAVVAVVVGSRQHRGAGD